MPQIVCENASLGYDGKPIVTDLSFTVNAGDYLCIVGENGSGKSTLMKTILNLPPPLAGSIYMEGLKPTQIGYLPQQTQVQRDFPASVLEIVLSGFQGQRGWRPFYTKEEKAAASANLKKLGLEGFERRCYRAGSSSGCCWHGRCAPLRNASCWTNPFPVWIPRPRRRCTKSSSSCTGRALPLS